METKERKNIVEASYSPAISLIKQKYPGESLSQIQNRLLHHKFGFYTNEFSQNAFRVRLYRFMAEAIPLIGSVIWTWSRLSAAPGDFKLYRDGQSVDDDPAVQVLDELFQKINKLNFGRFGSVADLLPAFFQSLFLDGAVAGALVLAPDLAGIEEFKFFDIANTSVNISGSGEVNITISRDGVEYVHTGPDLYYYALNNSFSNPGGRSVLSSIPFVAYVEQQLIDDMRRSMHNAGYHRLHVKIKPPDKKEGESDEVYVSRANSYFDSTVAMIKDIETEDNPVTWDDVAIEYIGPSQQGGVRSNHWYLTHRAMIEEICSGTHLAPFLLGYAYNTTTNWAQFKYDLVMRQVVTVQNAAVNFLEWLANVELSLKGFNLSARWCFDNSIPALAGEAAEVKNKEARRIIEFYKAGLIDRETAAAAAADLV